MKKIPAKYKRSGIKVKCLKCDRHVTDTCGLTKKSSSSCSHKNKHKYNLIVHVAGTKNGRRMRLLETNSFDDALIEMVKFRKELNDSNFERPELSKPENSENFVVLVTEYLDAISGKHPIHHFNLNQDEQSVKNKTWHLKHFTAALQKNKYHLKNLKISDLSDREVEVLREYWVIELGNSEYTYEKICITVKTFINWVRKYKDLPIKNPFSHVKVKINKEAPKIISKKEFEKVLKLTTPEHGTTKYKNRNVYRPYLKCAFRLALETGLRTKELVALQWSDLKAVEGGFILDINNSKVTSGMAGRSAKKYQRPVPVTASLMDVLNEFGLEKERGSDKYIIERPINNSAKTVGKDIQRAFNHFAKLVNPEIGFGELRNTYVTHLTHALKGNAKMFTGHSNDEVMRNHYISTAYIAGSLSELKLMDGKDPEQPENLLPNK